MTDYQTIINSPRAQSRMLTWFGGAPPHKLPVIKARRCRQGVKLAQKLNLPEELKFWQEQLAIAERRENKPLASE